jgi:hypothetical protein
MKHCLLDMKKHDTSDKNASDEALKNINMVGLLK